MFDIYAKTQRSQTFKHHCELMCDWHTGRYLLWFLSEEKAVVKFGLTEAAADDSDGTVVCSTVIVSPELK